MPLPEKAYKSLEFLSSPPARHIRILCEYEEPRQRFHKENVHHTLVFFGSARIASTEVCQARMEAATTPEETARAEIGLKMCRYYDEARELARRMTAWSMARETGRRFLVCSGGGPGIMEAANRGAMDVPGGRSVGLGISLPFEQGVNEYVTPELAFEFHYFFTRKYWFLYLCKALVIFPGGFGTLDELFETLTLVQTGKIKKKLPVVLYGKSYWSAVLNLGAMAEFGTISLIDLDLIHMTDDLDDAYGYLISKLDDSPPETLLSRV
ncbi:MAG: LOG family protein [Deltaproteobacteria bacterium]|nr:LOG family protein [Deltaproteobacteria bacterium]